MGYTERSASDKKREEDDIFSATSEFSGPEDPRWPRRSFRGFDRRTMTADEAEALRKRTEVLKPATTTTSGATGTSSASQMPEPPATMRLQGVTATVVGNVTLMSRPPTTPTNDASSDSGDSEEEGVERTLGEVQEDLDRRLQGRFLVALCDALTAADTMRSQRQKRTSAGRET